MQRFLSEEYFLTWESKARFNLTASSAESMTLTDLLSMATTSELDHYHKLWLGYTDPWGAQDLRQSISNTYNDMTAANILCFAGAEEGIYTALRVILNKDDHAIVVVPGYQSVETIALNICDVTGIALRENENWHLDIDEIAASIRSNTKLVAISFPNNPTGALIPRKDLNSLIELCRKNNIYLFSDEVHGFIEIGKNERLPQVADLYEKGLSLNVLSKAYGTPGLRIGWIASKDTSLLQELESYKAYLSTCNSGPSERLAMIILRNRKQIINKTKSIVDSNIQLLNSFFIEFSSILEWNQPQGGCIAYPSYKGKGNVEEFCQMLIDDASVFLLPASNYQSSLAFTPTNNFRIGFGRKTLFVEGLEAFGNFLRSHQNRLLK